ncbi:MAG: hypothetical protein M1492_00670 [Gammaproteobacteria bacterium]|nr:hypothetical protein [Gammaproteobacteria bacterium]
MTLKTQGLQTFDQIHAFVEGAQALDFQAPSRDEAYDWIVDELRRYTPADVQALAELDALHDTLSGPATRKLCERAYGVLHDARYECQSHRHCPGQKRLPDHL